MPKCSAIFFTFPHHPYRRVQLFYFPAGGDVSYMSCCAVKWRDHIFTKNAKVPFSWHYSEQNNLVLIQALQAQGE
jgi:hypothetical protein